MNSRRTAKLLFNVHNQFEQLCNVGLLLWRSENLSMEELGGEGFLKILWMSWVRTTPKIKVPIVTKTKPKTRRPRLRRRRREGSDLRLILIKQPPGKTKMKKAAKQPKKLITSPMLGTRIAHRSDRINQNKTITMRWISSLKVVASAGLFSSTCRFSKALTSPMVAFIASLPQKRRIG